MSGEGVGEDVAVGPMTGSHQAISSESVRWAPGVVSRQTCEAARVGRWCSWVVSFRADVWHRAGTVADFPEGDRPGWPGGDRLMPGFARTGGVAGGAPVNPKGLAPSLRAGLTAAKR